MTPLRTAGLVFGTALACFAQNPFPNPVRPLPAAPNTMPFGNVLFPGGTPAPHNNTFPMQLGNTVAGRPYGGGGHLGGGGFGRNRTVVVPYAVPVYYGGGYGGYDPSYYGGGAGYGQVAAPNVTVVVPQQPTTPVIINQTFTGTAETAPEPQRQGVHVYEGPKSPRMEAPEAPAPSVAAPAVAAPARRSYASDDRANIYMIALKDSTVKEAIGYWVEGGKTLAYVTPDATIGRVSLDMVDREASIQLNAQRNLEFDLRTR